MGHAITQWHKMPSVVVGSRELHYEEIEILCGCYHVAILFKNIDKHLNETEQDTILESNQRLSRVSSCGENCTLISHGEKDLIIRLLVHFTAVSI